MKWHFYLVVSGPLVLSTNGCEKPASTEADRTASAMPVDSTSYKPASSITLPPVYQSFKESLRTSAGIRRKVVTIHPSINFVVGMDDHPKERTVPLLTSYFIFDTKPARSAEPEWFEVGTSLVRKGDEFHVSAKDVIEWDTRMSAEIIAKSLDVYPSSEAIEDLVTDGKTSISPIARWLPPLTPRRVPWPIGRVHRFTSGGKEYEAVEIQMIGRQVDQNELEPANQTPVAMTKSKVVESFRTIEIAFVIDNTKSTEPYLAEIHRSLVELARKFDAELSHVQLRFAIVLYRDHEPELLFHENQSSSASYRWFGDRWATLDEVLVEIPTIGAAEDYSEDISEAGLDGLVRAIDDLPWSDSFSNRLIVWVGDAPVHVALDEKNPNRLTIEQVTADAIKKKIRIHSLMIPNDRGESYSRRQSSQFRRVALSTGGETRSIEQVGDLAEGLLTQFRKEASTSAEKGSIAERALSGASKDELKGSFDDQRVEEVFDLLGSTSIDGNGRSDVQHRSGWVLVTSPKGTTNINKLVWMTRDELDILITELTTLTRVLISTKDDFLSAAVQSRFEPWSFFATNEQERISTQTLKQSLEDRNIPVCTGILSKSREDFDHMTDEAKESLRRHVMKNILPRLWDVRNSDMFESDASGREMGPVPEGDLP